MNILFDFRCKVTYFSTLYIIRRSVVLYIELTVAEDLGTWYFVA